MKLTAMALVVGLALFNGCGAESVTANQVSNESSNEVVTSTGTQVNYQPEDYYTDWNKSQVTTITLGEDIKVSGTGAEVKDSVVTITSGGTYVVSGEVQEGQIVVDLLEKDIVRLVLNGASITCSTGSAIEVKSADKLVVSLEEGTENTLTDGMDYVLDEGSDEPNATLFSKDDLTINGAGTLTVNANYQDAIVSKDSLKIMEGNIIIQAADDAIRGKDMVAIKEGNITITAAGEGIKSTNLDDASLGFVYIENGAFNINTELDAIQAETNLEIIDGVFNITTGGGSVNGKSHTENLMMGKGGMGGTRPNREGMTAPTNEGITPSEGEGMTAPTNEGMTPPEGEGMTVPADEGMTPPEGEGMIAPANEGMTPPEGEGMTPPENEEMMPPEGEGMTPPTGDKTMKPENSKQQDVQVPSEESQGDVATEITVSAKALKAGNTITINGGKFNIDSADDAIHSNNTVVINGGELSIATGDDGIHGDAILTITDGHIDITKSYEGLEAATITIEGGEIYVVASDDGINAAEATGTENANGDLMKPMGNAELIVNGGYVYVDASGDGLDANGTITINGGTVIVDGPTNGGNGALDYDKTCDINGGILIAAGSAQMAQTSSSTSAQNAINITFTVAQEAGQSVSILDEEGNAVITFAPKKAFQTVFISSSAFETGKTYTYTYGGQIEGEATDGLIEGGNYTGGTVVTDFTINDVITYLNESGITTAQSNGMMGGHGQGGRGQKLQRQQKAQETRAEN